MSAFIIARSRVKTQREREGWRGERERVIYNTSRQHVSVVVCKVLMFIYIHVALAHSSSLLCLSPRRFFTIGLGTAHSTALLCAKSNDAVSKRPHNFIM